VNSVADHDFPSVSISILLPDGTFTRGSRSCFSPLADIDFAAKFPANRRERQRCDAEKFQYSGKPKEPQAGFPLDPDNNFPSW
jgi:hypothetical protein